MSLSINRALWDQWRERLRRFESSEQTVSAFCQSEDVSQAGFYQWRKKLERPSRSAKPRPGEGGRRRAHGGGAQTSGICARRFDIVSFGGVYGRADSGQRRSCGTPGE